jgi:hypothetical protein
VRIAGIVGTIVLLGAVAATIPSANAGQPDVGALIGDVQLERIRSHIDAIDEPRSSFAQPVQLQATADYVRGQLESYGYDVELEPVQAGPDEFPNVIGVQEGTMCPERVFIVGAHYDSVSVTPGADDNASGTAGMLEIARVLAGTPLPATVWFTGFTLEENGLVGSYNMAERVVEDGTQVVGMYSLEMIGYTTEEENGDFVAVIGNEASIRLNDAYHRARNAFLPDLPSAVLTLQGNGEEQPDSRRSDHAPFWDAGFQALLVSDTANFRNPNYHQPSDTLATLDLEFATNVTKAMLGTTVDYLTYDGNGDGEPDACSGPLAATPTPTGVPVTPSATPPESDPGGATPTPAVSPGALPDTGAGGGTANREPLFLVVALLGGGALAAGALVAGRARRAKR